MMRAAILAAFAAAWACGLYAVADASAAQARELTPSDLRRIEAINQSRNRQGAEASKGEPLGPCNWYAVNKALDLIKAGYGPGEVVIAEVHTPAGDDHAVAEVKDTLRGKPVTIVLDSLMSWTAERHDLEALGYSWTGAEFTR